jgi:hypothetical protein
MSHIVRKYVYNTQFYARKFVFKQIAVNFNKMPIDEVFNFC